MVATQPFGRVSDFTEAATRRILVRNILRTVSDVADGGMVRRLRKRYCVDPLVQDYLKVRAGGKFTLVLVLFVAWCGYDQKPREMRGRFTTCLDLVVWALVMRSLIPCKFFRHSNSSFSPHTLRELARGHTAFFA